MCRVNVDMSAGQKLLELRVHGESSTRQHSHPATVLEITVKTQLNTQKFSNGIRELNWLITKHTVSPHVDLSIETKGNEFPQL